LDDCDKTKSEIDIKAQSFLLCDKQCKIEEHVENVTKKYLKYIEIVEDGYKQNITHTEKYFQNLKFENKLIDYFDSNNHENKLINFFNSNSNQKLKESSNFEIETLPDIVQKLMTLILKISYVFIEKNYSGREACGISIDNFFKHSIGILFRFKWYLSDEQIKVVRFERKL
jgi:hypothetical protein